MIHKQLKQREFYFVAHKNVMKKLSKQSVKLVKVLLFIFHLSYNFSIEKNNKNRK